MDGQQNGWQSDFVTRAEARRLLPGIRTSSGVKALQRTGRLVGVVGSDDGVTRYRRTDVEALAAERRTGYRSRQPPLRMAPPTMPRPPGDAAPAIGASSAAATTAVLVARASELIDAGAEPMVLLRETLASPVAVLNAWRDALAMRGGGDEVREDEVDRQADLLDALAARVSGLERGITDRDAWLRSLAARYEATERRLGDALAAVAQLRTRVQRQAKELEAVTAVAVTAYQWVPGSR